MISLPEPVPLDMPPGDPGAVDDLVREIAGAAFHLVGVGELLRSPAASAPGWRGGDAEAAAGQVGRVAGLAGTSASAVLTAAGRLGAHAEVLRDTRRQVGMLREQQDEDRRSAHLRLMALADPRLAVMTGASGWAGVVEEFEAAEAARRRRHAMLLDDLAEDAAATVRELADATRPVGGTGRSGDGGRVLAHLALDLPGWGNPYLGHRGGSLARALLGDAGASGWNAAAEEALVHAGSAPFAQAFLLGLGAHGLRDALLLLGEGAFGDDMCGPSSPVARLLFSSIGAVQGAMSTGVAAVLSEPLMAPHEHGTDADMVALGMGAVLAVRAGSNGPGGSTVAAWGRQIVAREHAMSGDRGGTTAVERVFPAVAPRVRERFDPLPRVVESLAGRGDAAAAAALLSSPHAWDVLMSRSWGDDAAALTQVTEHAAAESGAAGRLAVRSALEAMGAGLVDGRPTEWTVDRATADSVTPALGRAVAAHIEVAAIALASAADEGGGAEPDHLLQGLGYLTVDREASATVEGALSTWVTEQPHDLAGSSRAHPLPAFAVPAAYLAVQEYGQRLTYALDGVELQHEAQRKKTKWLLMGGLVLEVASFSRVPMVAFAADGAKAVVPALLDADGTFTQGPDRGLRYGAEIAGGEVLATLPPDLSARADEARAQAEAAYRRAAGALGDPTPPTSPERWRVTFEAILDAAGGR